MVNKTLMLVPPELTDKILGCIPRHDMRTLNACAIASHQLLNMSRARGFAFLRIEHLRLDSLHAILASEGMRCTFNSQVRTLTLGGLFRPLPGSANPSVLSEVIESFPKLESLTFNSWFCEPFPLGLTNFPPLPHLTSLILVGLQFKDETFLLQLICNYSSLHTLELSAISFAKPDWVIPPLQLPSSLRRLTLDAEEREAPNLLTWMAALPPTDESSHQRRSTLEAEHYPIPPISFLRIQNASNRVAGPLYDLLSSLSGSLTNLSVYFKPGSERAEARMKEHPVMTSIPTLKLLTYSKTSVARSGSQALNS